MKSVQPSSGMGELETPNLILRRLHASDAKQLQILLQAKEIAANTCSIPYPYPPSAAKVWLDEQRAAEAAGDAVVRAVTRKLDHAPESGIAIAPLIGVAGLAMDTQHHNAELGYWIGKPYWGCGYGTEAVARVVKLGFQQHGLHRIHAHHFTRNPASGRVLQKIGMTYEGTLRHHVRKWGVFEDVAFYGMLATDPAAQNW